jgi:broad specificity phosphatase PhoE
MNSAAAARRADHAANRRTGNYCLDLTLVRHGQTACSVADCYCGSGCDVELTEQGAMTAAALARALGGQPYAALYVSPQRRARATLAPLAAVQGLQPQVLAGLAELNYGSWDGHTPATLKAISPQAFAAWREDPASHAPPGGETATALWARAEAAIAHIIAAHGGGGPAPVQVLAVAHNSTLRVLLSGLLGLPLARFRQHFDWPLGAWAQVRLTPSEAQLRTLGQLAPP